MRGRPAVPGVALVTLLHLALLWLVLRPIHQPVERGRLIWLQLWQPSTTWIPAAQTGATARAADLPPSGAGVLAKKPSRADAAAAPSRADAATASSRVDAASAPPSRSDAGAAVTASSRSAVDVGAAAPAGTNADAPVTLPSQSPSVDTPEVQALLAAPATTTSPPPDVVRQALKDLAAIDRRLRAEHPQTLKPSPDAPNARLARGFAAARDAVKPKWFEQARIELFSAPNDPKRIYRVITATGEYCLFYPDTGSISFNSAPKSGWAGSGQPTMSDCPTRF